MASDKEIGVVMAMLSAGYPHLNIPKETGQLYKQLLADVPAEALMDAARDHICRGSKFFPTIFELRQPYEQHLKREKAERDDREWKHRVEEWKSEKLPAGEAAKLLGEVNEKAGTALIAVKGGASRIVKRDFKAGAGATDEEWSERKRRMKEGA